MSSLSDRKTWCSCARDRVPYDDCDGCYDEDPTSEDEFVEPPLYPDGKLAGMTLEDLEREHDGQCDRQGRLGDAERIDDRAVEQTEMRCRLVEAEIRRRKAAP